MKFGILAAVWLLAMPAAHAGIDEARAAATRGDYQAALKALQPLVDKNDADAQNMLGWMCMQGAGVAKSQRRG